MLRFILKFQSKIVLLRAMYAFIILKNRISWLLQNRQIWLFTCLQQTQNLITQLKSKRLCWKMIIIVLSNLTRCWVKGSHLKSFLDKHRKDKSLKLIICILLCAAEKMKHWRVGPLVCNSFQYKWHPSFSLKKTAAKKILSSLSLVKMKLMLVLVLLNLERNLPKILMNKRVKWLKKRFSKSSKTHFISLTLYWNNMKFRTKCEKN